MSGWGAQQARFAQSTRKRDLTVPAQRGNRLGKFSAPGTEGIQPRHRLFAALDRARRGALLWVAAPAGAGKTTLLASWLHSRKLACLWYQADEGDSDPATFLHCLCLAAEARTRRRLPRPTPESGMALEPFARRFFGSLFAAWTQPHVWVIDNYQALTPDSPTHRLLDIALERLPRDCFVAVASRQEPPRLLSARLAYSGADRLGWEALRLTEAEAWEMAEGQVSRETASALHRASGGWVALQRLMVRLHRGSRPEEPLPHADLLSDFLDSEVLGTLGPERRRVLAELAVLPESSAPLAKRLTGYESAGALLARLSREQLLTTRHRPGRRNAAIRYQFHPLLREHLLGCLERERPPGVVRDLRERAARLLAAEGEVEVATELAAAARSWDLLAELVTSQAPALMSQGRIMQLSTWLARLPETEIQARPWLGYWHGVSIGPRDPACSRPPLERAYRQFLDIGDARGAWLAWAAIFESYAMPWNDYRPVRPWLAELERLQERFPEIPDPEIEAAVLGAGTTLFLGDPFHPLLVPWAQRAGMLLGHLPPHLVGPLAYFYALYHVGRGDGAGIRDAKALLDRIHFPESTRPSYPYSVALYASAQVLLGAASLLPDEAGTWVERGVVAAREADQPLLEFILRLHAVHAAGMVGDTEAAAAQHRASGRLFDPSLTLQTLLHGYNEACIRLMKGDVASARDLAVSLIGPMEAAGAGFPIVITRLVAAQALALEGEGASARTHLPPVLDFARRFPSPTLEFQAELTLARIEFDAGNDQRGQAHLEHAMALSRRTGCSMELYLFADFLAPLCARALQLGVETEHVRRLIRRYRLQAPYAGAEWWPWPIRIYTLGRFRIALDETPITFTGKAPRRPLQLLKAIIAFGGHEVPYSRLVDALWSDTDYEDAQSALVMAISRLRKLLKSADAIAIRDGKVSIDPEMCWVDAIAFRQAAEAMEGNHAGGDDLEAVFRLYRGDFLAEEEDAPWALSARHTLAHRFQAMAASVACRMEEAGDDSGAVAIYQYALDYAPLAEPLYRNLMALYLRKREPAEALQVYRRCQKTLAATLGAAPGAATEALAAQARSGSRPVSTR